MTTLEDIEKAVTQLPSDQLAKFRAWFEDFGAARFDLRIERDAAAGGSIGWPSRRLPISEPGTRANCETFRKPLLLASV